MKAWSVIIALALLVGAVFVFEYQPITTVFVQRSVVPPATTVLGQPVTLLFVGDVMLSRSVGDFISSNGDWSWPFERIASVTAAADLTFGNLETTISTRGAKNGCGFCFRSDPRTVAGLKLAGFDVMSVANNHVWDYGPQAFDDTLAALASAGIDPVGGGKNIVVARNGIVRTVRGTRVGYLAYTDLLPRSAQAGPGTPGVSEFDMDQMKEDIIAMRTKADIVVVSFHGGIEYLTTHTPRQEEIYHAAIDAGADLLIGSHPHVVEDIEHYHRGWIAYSMGNFVFDQDFSQQTTHSIMLSVQVQNKAVTQVNDIPIMISNQYQPSLILPK